MHVKRAQLSIQTPPPSRHSLVVALFPSTDKRSTTPRTAIVCCFECVQCARWDKIRTSDRHMRVRGGEFSSLSSVFRRQTISLSCRTTTHCLKTHECIEKQSLLHSPNEKANHWPNFWDFCITYLNEFLWYEYRGVLRNTLIKQVKSAVIFYTCNLYETY